MAATSRRSVLAGFIGGVAGAILGRFGAPPVASAADGGPVLIGALNTAASPTTLEMPSTLPGPAAGPVLRVASSGDALGVAIEAHSMEDFAIVADGYWGAIKATSPNGPALQAWSTVGSGVDASCAQATGLHAITGGAPVSMDLASRRDYAVWADATHGVGVLANAGPTAAGTAAIATNIGVHGVALDGTDARGVYGRAAAGQGVRGEAATGIGVYARATTGAGTALRVSGRATFSNARRATVRAGTSSVAVSMVGVTSSSVALANVLADAPGTYVRATVPGSGTVRVILNRAVTKATPVSVFVVN